MARATARGGWSYSAGERGRNRVRVFERPDRDGRLLLQFAERDATGRLCQRRVALGAVSRVLAKAKADELAARFATLGPTGVGERVTLRSLFDIYERDVSSQKGESKRRHDGRCATMFLGEFGADHDPRTLSRREWDQFIVGRRRGTISPLGVKKGRPVRDRVIGYDLKFLVAVLNWACTVRDSRGQPLLERNPLKGLPIPTESSPRRAVIVAEQLKKLRKAARRLGRSVELLLTLCHETGHRVGAVRQLRWSDVDLSARRVTWRGEHDKMGQHHVTQLSRDAVAALRAMRQKDRVIGDAWVFRSHRDSAQPWSRFYVRQVWDQLAKSAKLPSGERYGWHALRRKFASELKHIPLKDLCELGGWKSAQTILTCYQQGDEATQRAALAQRKTLRVSGLRG